MRLFPDKPLELGLYLFDYCNKRRPMPLRAFQYQFGKALEYLLSDRIAAVHLLGSYLRDEKEWPANVWAAKALREAP